MDASCAPPSQRTEQCPRTSRITLWVTTSIALVIVIPVGGVGVVALLATGGTSNTWTRWGNVGDAFGAINSVLSGLAVVALIFTFWVQFQELREQRQELALQRESLTKAQTDLHRSAETGLRRLHFDLLRLAIDDPGLARVWPELSPEISHKRNRQYLYANLVYQHVLMTLRIGYYDETAARNSLRYLFTSSLMREFWRATAETRAAQTPDTPDAPFAAMADEICAEYDLLISRSTGRGHGAPPPVRSATQYWQNVNGGQKAPHPAPVTEQGYPPLQPTESPE